MKWLVFLGLSVWILPILCMSQDIIGAGERPQANVPVLIDEFGTLGDCDLGARTDAFLIELNENPEVRGYVISYNGIEVLPSQYGSPAHQRTLQNHISFRRFDSSRITFVNGGFRDRISTQFWIVPIGSDTPALSPTLPEPMIPYDRTFLFDKRYLMPDWISEDMPSFILPEVLEREKAEADNWQHSEEEYVDDATDEVEENEDVESMTPEEIEKELMSWISPSFVNFLTERPDTTGVLVFYADDQRYDIRSLTELIEKGVQKIESQEDRSVGRIRYIFGGYRDFPGVEYWIVPQGGKDPLPQPEERSVDEESEVSE
ncbi:MAG: hypothetical protein KF685_13890 [Acidobacteria bacterium]|nr:hypothetical protein [Acidobacteriota bacterium]